MSFWGGVCLGGNGRHWKWPCLGPGMDGYDDEKWQRQSAWIGVWDDSIFRWMSEFFAGFMTLTFIFISISIALCCLSDLQQRRHQ